MSAYAPVDSASNPASQRESAPRPVTPLGTVFSKTCVLVADNDADLRGLIMWRLRREGYIAIEAADAQQIVACAADFRPSLILLGTLGQDQDCLDIYRRLKSDPYTNGIPVIMMPVNGDAHKRVEVLRLGVEDYFPQPFDLKVLMWRVRAAIQRHAIRALFSAPAPSL
jgi:DNA-binding response OmpR family regulator